MFFYSSSILPPPILLLFLLTPPHPLRAYSSPLSFPSILPLLLPPPFISSSSSAFSASFSFSSSSFSPSSSYSSSSKAAPAPPAPMSSLYTPNDQTLIVDDSLTDPLTTGCTALGNRQPRHLVGAERNSADNTWEVKNPLKKEDPSTADVINF